MLAGYKLVIKLNPMLIYSPIHVLASVKCHWFLEVTAFVCDVFLCQCVCPKDIATCEINW